MEFAKLCRCNLCKHICVKKFTNSQSIVFNYIGYFSMILMATTDAVNLFTTIDVCDLGRNNDRAVFKASHMTDC